MAYRKLKFGDHVRIVDIYNVYHGHDAIVINEVNEHWNRVQILNSSVCLDFPNKNLLVRDDECYFIKDGVLDHMAQSAHHAKLRSTFESRNSVDSEEECEYAHWDREDLIQEIKELKERLDEVERDWEDS